MSTVTALPISPRSAAATAVPFVVGDENAVLRTAVAALLKSLPASYNPLVLCGPTGCGKSHVAEGLAQYWRSANVEISDEATLIKTDEKSDADAPRAGRPSGKKPDPPSQLRVVHLAAIDFGRDYIDAFQTQTLPASRQRFRQADLLVLEDLGQLVVQKWRHQQAIQLELAQTLDHVTAHGGQVVITCENPPAVMADLLPPLRSRLQSGLTIGVKLPAASTRLALVQMLLEQNDQVLESPGAQMLVESFPTARGLIGAVQRLIQIFHPKTGGRKTHKIPAEAVEKLLQQQPSPPRPGLHQIATHTARFFNLTLAELRKPGRQRARVRARSLAMLLSRRLTNKTLNDIGDFYGGRDHSTVLHACRRAIDWMQDDADLAQGFVQIQRDLGLEPVSPDEDEDGR